MANETSYMTSYMWIMVTNLLSCTILKIEAKTVLSWGANNKYGRHVAIFEIKLSQAFSLHQVWKKSSWCCSSYGCKCVYIQDGRQSAILNDMKNLFEVHNPQTLPDLGLKFQTIWSIHFWEIAVHRSTYVRTYVRTNGRSPNYKPPNPLGWGLITHGSPMHWRIIAALFLSILSWRV